MGYFALFCFAILALISHQSLAKTDLTKEICEHAVVESKELCHSVFAAHPESKTADFKGLAHIAIDAAIKEAKNIRTKLRDLLEPSGHEKTKKAVKECFDIYEQAIDSFNKSKTNLESKKLATFFIWSRVGCSAGQACEEGFSEMRSGAKGASPLTKMSKKYDDICGIVMAISFKMADKKA